MTFAYTDLDKVRITEAVGGQCDFQSTKDHVQDFRNLEYLKRKYIAYDLHLRTLAEYVRLQRIPQGLRVNLCPTLFSSEKEYCSKWESILNKCSTDLMLATMERLQQEIPVIKREAEQAEKELKEQFTAAVVADGLRKLTDQMEKFDAELRQRKRSKFQPDAADYTTGNVYSWQWRVSEATSARRGSLGNSYRCRYPSRSGAGSTRERSDSASTSLSSASSQSSFLGGSLMANDMPGTGNIEGAESTEIKRKKPPTQYSSKQW